MQLRVIALAGLAVVVAIRSRHRVRRYAVAEMSMTPTLLPGDYVVAVAVRSPVRTGEIIVFEHPERPGYELVKRVVGVGGDTMPAEHPVADGEIFVMGDNSALSSADSRTLGTLVPDDPHWRVVARYWPNPRLFPTPGPLPDVPEAGHP